MDDLEFVQSCIRQDKGAWDEFLRKYSRLIYNYILSILNKSSAAVPQSHCADIFQEIFHSLVKDNFKKLRSFRAKNGCSLASWLRQVAINSTIDYLRRLKPAAVSIDQADEGESPLKDSLAGGYISAADALTDKEKLAGLRECI